MFPMQQNVASATDFSNHLEEMYFKLYSVHFFNLNIKNKTKKVLFEEEIS